MPPSFLILGCGPIGGIFATFTAPHSKEIAIVDTNKPHLEKIRKEGLTTIINAEVKKTKFIALYQDTDEISGHHYDYLVVATKTPVMEKVIPSLVSFIPKDTTVISLQNGIGTEDFLAQHLSPTQILRVVVNYAGTMTEPGIIRQTFFNPPNYIGACAKEGIIMAKGLADLLTSAGLKTKFTEDIKKYEWEKATMNTAMCSISALTGLNMKEVMTLPPTRNLITAIMEEIIAVAKANKIGLAKDYLQESLAYLDQAGPHIPSMRLDIEGRRETEVNFLNQKILDAAKKAGVITPNLECITILIRGLQEGF